MTRYPLTYLLMFSCSDPTTVQMAKLLLDAGADPNTTDPENDWAALAEPAFALTEATWAWAALNVASDWSTAAWLTTFCASSARLRSWMRWALARFASASAICERLAATAAWGANSDWPISAADPTRNSWTKWRASSNEPWVVVALKPQGSTCGGLIRPVGKGQ